MIDIVRHVIDHIRSDRSLRHYANIYNATTSCESYEIRQQQLSQTIRIGNKNLQESDLAISKRGHRKRVRGNTTRDLLA
jgi:hypothetical protein